MLRFVLRRAGSALLVMFSLSVLVFLIFFATPGTDPAARIAGKNASQQTLREVRQGVRARQADARAVRADDEEAVHHA